ncbi:MAG: hypothetical protein GXO18_02690 [Aquificae bacterium]|nr:hypothetical protein [Aquificota bacterium]
MRKLWVLVGALLVLLSCSQKVLVPVGNGVKVDERNYSAVYEDERVKIFVKANAWEGYPSDLDDLLLPLYVEIRNKGREVIEVRREDIFLIDDRGNQYNALDPKDAAEVARGDTGVGVGVGIGVGTPHYGVGWTVGTPIYTDVEDVINKAFIPGRVLPGRKLKGFVYFQKLPDEVNRLTLKLGYRIGEAYRVAEFKFKVRDGKGSSDNGDKESREGSS